MVTASVSLMPDITRAVGVARALVVPFGLGCPFGAPGDRAMQMRVMQAVLDMCRRSDAPVAEAFKV